MCGIAGWFGNSSRWKAEELRAGLRQRGPDGSGVWQGKDATLVHTRLAIIGLGEEGAQPMVRGSVESESGGSRSALVFNGEIYNFRELGAASAKSDTAVLLDLLCAEGEKCLGQLAGMFAFAFYREKEDEGLLARDAFGIKPLYYRLDGSTLTFASDSRLLRQVGDKVDSTALRDFFLWGTVPEPATLTRDIRQIPAGHYLRWKNGKAEILRWYMPELRRNKRMRYDEAVTKTRAALVESMRRHLVSDVPVGVFLSGGIDSTAVLALARQVLGPEREIRTLSIGFDDPEFDESSVAKRTAEHFGARHTEWRMNSADGGGEVREYLRAIDQPTIDGFNTWCVSKLARREGIKVVLSGLGGDEWFRGYGSFTRVPQLRAFHLAMPPPLRNLLATCCEKEPAGSPRRRICAFLRGGGSWLEAFHAMRGIFSTEEAGMLAESLTGLSPAAPDWSMGDSPVTGVEIAGWMETTRYMRNQLLRDSDVFSMAHGVELRVPFVDVRLAEVLLDLPPRYRLQKGKALLVDAVPEIPDWVRNRPKQGFVFPFAQWMQGAIGEVLQIAAEASPVPLKTWYRTWALAVAKHSLTGLECGENKRALGQAL